MTMSGRTQTIEFLCRECHKQYGVQVRPQDVERWKQGELIQNALPYLTDAERELFLSGICGPCFDRMFREDIEDVEV
jgi:hypothetical protein